MCSHSSLLCSHVGLAHKALLTTVMSWSTSTQQPTDHTLVGEQRNFIRTLVPKINIFTQKLPASARTGQHVCTTYGNAGVSSESQRKPLSKAVLACFSARFKGRWV